MINKEENEILKIFIPSNIEVKQETWGSRDPNSAPSLVPPVLIFLYFLILSYKASKVTPC